MPSGAVSGDVRQTNLSDETQKEGKDRRELTPDQQAAFDALGKIVFADGALPAKIKQIVAGADAHVTQCPYCINGHTRAALRAGATP